MAVVIYFLRPQPGVESWGDWRGTETRGKNDNCECRMRNEDRSSKSESASMRCRRIYRSYSGFAFAEVRFKKRLRGRTRIFLDTTILLLLTSPGF